MSCIAVVSLAQTLLTCFFQSLTVLYYARVHPKNLCIRERNFFPREYKFVLKLIRTEISLCLIYNMLYLL